MTGGGTLCKLDLAQIRAGTVQQWPYTVDYLGLQMENLVLATLCVAELERQMKAGNITPAQFLRMSKHLTASLEADVGINKWTEANGTES